MAPKKALEAVWLRGLSTLPAVGCANHLSAGTVDKTDRLMNQVMNNPGSTFTRVSSLLHRIFTTVCY